MDNNEDLSPYEYEVACNLEDSLIGTIISLAQAQDIDMFDSYYVFLYESLSKEMIGSLIAQAYLWIKENDKAAYTFFHPYAMKLTTPQDIKDATEILEATEDEDALPVINFTCIDIVHILLDGGYKNKIDYKAYKRIVKIFNPLAVKYLTAHFDMDSISDLIKVHYA